MGSSLYTLLMAMLVPAMACFSSTKSVRMPDGLTAIRIECNYEKVNCERRARDVCHGHFEVVSEGDESCESCGMELNGVRSEGNNVYTGVLYVRCSDAVDRG